MATRIKLWEIVKVYDLKNHIYDINKFQRNFIYEWILKSFPLWERVYYGIPNKEYKHWKKNENVQTKV